MMRQFFCCLLKSFIFVFFFTFNGTAAAAKRVPGSTHFIFGDKSNIRKEPHPRSQIVNTLRGGTKVRIIKSAERPMQMGGITEDWYQIESKGGPAYIWGGVLADAEFIFDNYLLMVKDLGLSKNKMALRIRRGGKQIAERQWVSGPVKTDEKITFNPHKSSHFKTQPPQLVFSLEYFVYSDLKTGTKVNTIFTLANNNLREGFTWIKDICEPTSCLESWVLWPDQSLPDDKSTQRPFYKAPAETIRVITRKSISQESTNSLFFENDYKWNGSRIIALE